MVAVELVARDCKGSIEAVLSLGCVQYEAVRRVYDARQSQTVSQRLSQTNLISIFISQKVRLLVFFFLKLKFKERHVLPDSPQCHLKLYRGYNDEDILKSVNLS